MPETENTLTLRPNLIRRVENYSLAPSVPANALVPIYEAVYNSIHAIQDRFGLDDWSERGRISVTQFFDVDRGLSFEITDNGAGLTPPNFESFLTYDSDLKKQRGGKGIGRIAWLKVFTSALVTSVYAVEGEERRRRTFRFVLDNEYPIRDHVVENNVGDEIGTSVILIGMKPSYTSHLPAKASTVANKLVSHFISYLVGDRVLQLTYADKLESHDIKALLSTKTESIGSDKFTVDDGDIVVTHTLLDRSVTDQSGHKLYYSANGRIVLEQEISAPLGLPSIISRDGFRKIYAGIVSGNVLDSAVNTERTNFDLAREAFATINARAISFVKEALSQDVNKVIDRQAELVREVVKKFPRYSYLIGNPRQFAESRMPRSVNKAEEVYQHLAVYDFRESRRLERDVEGLTRAKSATETAEEIAAGTKELLTRLSNQEFSALADYTVRRKVVIDLLDKRLGRNPDGDGSRYSEAAVHSVICPMRVTSQDVAVDHHNLWILDDRLAYYEFWASDRRIKDFVADSDNAMRPDLALFSGQALFHRPGTNQPVVIVEFKKPARDAYDYESNPISQTYEYIDALRGGQLQDKDGKVIDYIGEDQPFFVYIVADFTKNLRRFLKTTQINTPIPGGLGYYGFNPDYNAFFNVLNYRYVVEDARMRNEAFFRRLGI